MIEHACQDLLVAKVKKKTGGASLPLDLVRGLPATPATRGVFTHAPVRVGGLLTQEFIGKGDEFSA